MREDDKNNLKKNELVLSNKAASGTEKQREMYALVIYVSTHCSARSRVVLLYPLNSTSPTNCFNFVKKDEDDKEDGIIAADNGNECEDEGSDDGDGAVNAWWLESFSYIVII